MSSSTSIAGIDDSLLQLPKEILVSSLEVATMELEMIRPSAMSSVVVKERILPPTAGKMLGGMEKDSEAQSAAIDSSSQQHIGPIIIESTTHPPGGKLASAHPHVCTHCNKAFARRTNLRRHENHIHGTTLPKATCEICSKTFKYKPSLARHMKTCPGPMGISSVPLPEVQPRSGQSDASESGATDGNCAKSAAQIGDRFASLCSNREVISVRRDDPDLSVIVKEMCPYLTICSQSVKSHTLFWQDLRFLFGILLKSGSVTRPLTIRWFLSNLVVHNIMGVATQMKETPNRIYGLLLVMKRCVDFIKSKQLIKSVIDSEATIAKFLKRYAQQRKRDTAVAHQKKAASNKWLSLGEFRTLARKLQHELNILDGSAKDNLFAARRYHNCLLTAMHVMSVPHRSQIYRALEIGKTLRRPQSCTVKAMELLPDDKGLPHERPPPSGGIEPPVSIDVHRVTPQSPIQIIPPSPTSSSSSSSSSSCARYSSSSYETEISRSSGQAPLSLPLVQSSSSNANWRIVIDPKTIREESTLETDFAKCMDTGALAKVTPSLKTTQYLDQPLPPYLSNVMSNFLSRWRPIIMKAHTPCPSHDHVFMNWDGSAPIKDIGRPISKVVLELVGRSPNPHLFRSMFATFAVGASLHPEKLMSVLGCAMMNSPERIRSSYVVTDPRQDAKLAQDTLDHLLADTTFDTDGLNAAPTQRSVNSDEDHDHTQREGDGDDDDESDAFGTPTGATASTTRSDWGPAYTDDRPTNSNSRTMDPRMPANISMKRPRACAHMVTSKRSKVQQSSVDSTTRFAIDDHHAHSCKVEEQSKEAERRKSPVVPRDRLPTGARKRKQWNECEVGALKAGVQSHGTGAWREILRDPLLKNRTNVDLKDKWRLLQRQNQRAKTKREAD